MAARAHRSGWISLCVTLLARTTLGILASLLLWAVLPIVFGAKPTVVMTGSMLPRLVPGDVVVSRPVPAADLRLGQTLLFHDPDQAGHLRLHRWVEVATDGRLITKGDANPENDSTPIGRDAVVGVASLRIPFVARPVVWANDGRTDLLALTAAGLLATVVAACWFRAADEDADVAADDDAPSGDADADVPEEPHRPAHPRRLVHAAVALLVVGGLGATAMTEADAAPAFSRTTANNADSWTAARYFSCAGAARGADARFAWPLSETGGSTAADVSGNGIVGSYAGGITYRTPGPCADSGAGVTLNGTSGVISTNSAADSIPELTFQVWFRTTTTRGGTLMSLTATTGFLFTTDTTSMALAMTTTGALSLGVSANGTKRITTSGTYRDNVWHLATGVVGAQGMVLYVDGVAAVSSTAATTTVAVTGTPRVGYGDASDLGTGTYDYFQGSLAYASLTKAAYTADEALAQYRAAA